MNSCIYAWMYVYLCNYVCRGACIYCMCIRLAYDSVNVKRKQISWFVVRKISTFYLEARLIFYRGFYLVASYVGLATALPVLRLQRKTADRKISNHILWSECCFLNLDVYINWQKRPKLRLRYLSIDKKEIGKRHVKFKGHWRLLGAWFCYWG